jgi:hypothetical protein
LPLAEAVEGHRPQPSTTNRARNKFGEAEWSGCVVASLKIRSIKIVLTAPPSDS